MGASSWLVATVAQVRTQKRALAGVGRWASPRPPARPPTGPAASAPAPGRGGARRAARCRTERDSSAPRAAAAAARPGPGPDPRRGCWTRVSPHPGGPAQVAQMVTLLVAFTCVRSSAWTDYSAYSYFEVVTICDLIMILAFYLIHLFRFYRVLTCISWPLSELLHYLIGTLLLLIASVVAASKSYNQSGLVAGAIFGFVATFLCLASLWLSYKISCVTQSTDVSA
uniref:CKLF-like MARVEL transmembrane domain-containing protein 7 n=1 Tax=Castor canadensis TaxID=51338 RepID=A0A8B7UPV2_CASCN|nr:CKLF-like MARVEL transmembrane domain-containing protein 7 [Castor canadensis]